MNASGPIKTSKKVTRRTFLESTARMAAAGFLGVRGLRPAPTGAQSRPGRLVVDGLDTSIINDEYLELIREGGAHCVHKSLGGLDTFAALEEFVAARPDEVVIARTVADIRQAHREGKISFVMGSQAAGGAINGNGLDLLMQGRTSEACDSSARGSRPIGLAV